ncbi:ATP synthase subunit I [Desulfoplanes sp.]
MTAVVDRYLYQHGFRIEGVRWLVRNQIVLTVLAVFLLPLCFLGGWPVDLLAGAVIGTLNFYALAKVIQGLVFLRQGSVQLLLFGFYARLGLTGVALYVLIAWCGASVVALLVGLSLVLVNILMYGAKYFVGQKLKEA